MSKMSDELMTKEWKSVSREIFDAARRAAREYFLRNGIGSFNEGNHWIAQWAIDFANHLDPGKVILFHGQLEGVKGIAQNGAYQGRLDAVQELGENITFP